MRLLALAALLLTAASAPFPVKLIPGQFDPERNPDGNTVIFEDASRLVVVDTGRHKAQQAAILDYAKERGKPIVAIVNSHWHLDHSGGNQEIRAVFPKANLYTSNAVKAALDDFLARGLARNKARVADPKVSDADKAEARLGVDAVEDRTDLIPDRPVTGPTSIKFGARPLRLYLAKSAATAGDTYLYDPTSRTLVAGDLVVLPAPFFDTACSEGWRKALDAIARQPFAILIPGHGPSMTHAQFMTYRTAFGRLIDCAESKKAKADCVAGWRRDAAPLLTGPKDVANADLLIDYYIDNGLRDPAFQRKWCAAT
ncbi:MAG: MBL fold metallo-hydrolase [Sphingomonas sp.]